MYYYDENELNELLHEFGGYVSPCELEDNIEVVVVTYENECWEVL